MESFTQLLYTLLVYLSIVTSFFAVTGLICSFYCLRTVHINLRILTISYGTLWCIFAGGCFFFVFILNAEEAPPVLYQTIPYQIPKMIATSTGYAFRVIECSISFERYVATVFFETYEKRSIYKIYSFFAVFLSFFIAFCFSFLFNVVRIPAYVIYVFLVSVETVNFFLLHRLRKQNLILRKLSNCKRALLTSKYQLIENITSLNLLFPQATISFFLSNATLLFSIIVGSFYEPYRVPIFFSLYCVNVIIISIYWIYRSHLLPLRIFKRFLIKFRQINDSTEVIVLKATTVKTALGENIKAQQTVDEHFKSLKDVWK